MLQRTTLESHIVVQRVEILDKKFRNSEKEITNKRIVE
jgi:hypothetical protein